MVGSSIVNPARVHQIRTSHALCRCRMPQIFYACVRVAIKRMSAQHCSNLTTSTILILLFALTPGWVSADQNDPQLDSLFESLQQAETNFETQIIQNEIWQRWLDAPDSNSADLLSQLTQAMSVAQYDLALRLANQLVDSSPDFAEAWNKRATIQYLMGNHGLSVGDIKQTLLLEPRHFGALSGLGLIFMHSGNFAAARDAFDAVLELSPASDNARGSVARAESMIGDDI